MTTTAVHSGASWVQEENALSETPEDVAASTRALVIVTSPHAKLICNQPFAKDKSAISEEAGGCPSPTPSTNRPPAILHFPPPPPRPGNAIPETASDEEDTPTDEEDNKTCIYIDSNRSLDHDGHSRSISSFEKSNKDPGSEMSASMTAINTLSSHIMRHECAPRMSLTDERLQQLESKEREVLTILEELARRVQQDRKQSEETHWASSGPAAAVAMNSHSMPRTGTSVQTPVMRALTADTVPRTETKKVQSILRLQRRYLSEDVRKNTVISLRDRTSLQPSAQFSPPSAATPMMYTNKMPMSPLHKPTTTVVTIPISAHTALFTATPPDASPSSTTATAPHHYSGGFTMHRSPTTTAAADFYCYDGSPMHSRYAQMHANNQHSTAVSRYVSHPTSSGLISHSQQSQYDTTPRNAHITQCNVQHSSLPRSHLHSSIHMYAVPSSPQRTTLERSYDRTSALQGSGHISKVPMFTTLTRINMTTPTSHPCGQPLQLFDYSKIKTRGLK